MTLKCSSPFPSSYPSAVVLVFLQPAPQFIESLFEYLYERIYSICSALKQFERNGGPDET
jgi:hypothetical protein